MVKVLLAVAAAELILWAVGAWSWISYCLRHWPWLLERYSLVFPLLLLIMLLAARRLKYARSHFVTASVIGSCSGLVSGQIAYVLAHLITPSGSTRLWNSWQMDPIGFMIIVFLFSFYFTIGWIYCASASLLALAADRGEAYLRDSRRAAQALQ